MQAICWLRPEIFFSYRNYLTIFSKNNASHRKAQVLIVNRKLAAFLPQICGKKCNMRYKSLDLKHCMRCPPLREGGCVAAGRVTCTQHVITSQSPAAPAPLKGSLSFNYTLSASYNKKSLPPYVSVKQQAKT